MKKANNDNKNKKKFSTKSVSKFYNNNKTLINGLGIATVAGVAAYSVFKWLPFQDIVHKMEEKFESEFADREFPHTVGQEV